MILSRDERLKNARRGLWRTALVWTPLFLAAGGGGVYFLILQITGSDGYGWVLPIVLLAFGVLFGFQSIQALRDLHGGTVTITGFITRHWWRLDLVARSNYLRIDYDKIFRTDRVQWLTIDKDDYVEVEYFPSSMIAVTIEKREAPEGAGPPRKDPSEPAPREPDPLLIERD